MCGSEEIHSNVRSKVILIPSGSSGTQIILRQGRNSMEESRTATRCGRGDEKSVRAPQIGNIIITLILDQNNDASIRPSQSSK